LLELPNVLVASRVHRGTAIRCVPEKGRKVDMIGGHLRQQEVTNSSTREGG